MVAPYVGTDQLPPARPSSDAVHARQAQGPSPQVSPRQGLRKLRRLSARGIGPLLLVCDLVTCVLVATAMNMSPRNLALVTAGSVAALAHRGSYRSWLNLSVLDQLPTLVGAPSIAGASTAAVAEYWGGEGQVRLIALTGVLTGCAIVFSRLAAFSVVRLARRRGLTEHRALVLGAGQVGLRVVRTLQERPEYGLRAVAAWDNEPLLNEDTLGIPVIDDCYDLASVISLYRPEVVIIAFARYAESSLVDVVRTCDRMRCEILVVPRLFELHQRDGLMDELRGMPLMRLRRATFRSWSWRLKRLFDILVSASLLTVCAPLMAAVALAVRYEGGRSSPGVLFRQRRVGLGGETLNLLKFRSMRPVNDQESATLWSVTHDARVGPVGRIIRRSSLDELPQLWNVLRGDMSLVGPRPERPHFVKQFTAQYPRYMARHRVPAGLTGWSQVNGLRGDTSIEERAAFDNYYIENWSLWLDIKILLRTVLTLLSRERR